MNAIPLASWQDQIGYQRDWVWRGWQTRYTFLRNQGVNQDSAPLILLHGFGASIGHWRKNMPVLSEYHPVYALDMLGFGASEKAVADYQINLWIEQVHDFWQTFVGRPAILVGNSIGSLICMAAAATYPEMVQGIVMMSLPDPNLEAELIPTPLRPIVVGIKKLVTTLLAPTFYLVRQPGFVRKWASIAYANPEEVSDELVEILTGPAQDRGAFRAFWAIFRGMSLPDARLSAKAVLPELKIPILLIWGKQDRMVPYTLARPQQFTQYNSRLTLLELENCGHCPHDECPDQVNEAILHWLTLWPQSLVPGSEQVKMRV